MSVEELYSLMGNDDKVKTLKEIQNNNKIKVEFLKKLIKNKKLTHQQCLVIALRLGYTNLTFAKKYYIGPRTNSQIAKILGIAKCTVTKRLLSIRKKVTLIHDNKR